MTHQHPGQIRWWWRLPSVLLILVAVNQYRLVVTASLSPWWGGGFGMFATTDAWATRHLHVYAVRSGVRRALPLPQELHGEIEQALTLPTDSRLRELALQLAPTPTPEDGPLEAIELQVWATQFEQETLAPASVPIRFLTILMNET